MLSIVICVSSLILDLCFDLRGRLCRQKIWCHVINILGPIVDQGGLTTQRDYGFVPLIKFRASFLLLAPQILGEDLSIEILRHKW